jgi:hypothetical protein
MSEAIASTAIKENGATASLLSKRALQRLAEMQHALTFEMRGLSEQHSRFIGALMACDTATQQAMMLEYRDQLHAVHAIIAKLRMLLERFCDESEVE